MDSPVVRALTEAQIYRSGNISNHPWYAADQDRSLIILKDTPFDAPPVTTLPARKAFDAVLANVGATCPKRDAADRNVIRTVRDKTGGLMKHQDHVGGWPQLASGTPRKDGDGDGMPDAWETRHGLNPNDAGDAKGDRDGDGYTNIEEWVNSLAEAPSAMQGARQKK